MTTNGKKRSVEAGQKNLQTYNESVSSGEAEPGAKTHGAYSVQVRQRYSDKRTTEGKQLAAIIDGLVNELGGPSEVSTAQQLILGNIRSKLIVLFQINKHVDQQKSIINDKGELLPCLGRNYTTYSESLRRDIEALFAVTRSKRLKVPTISDIVGQSK